MVVLKKIKESKIYVFIPFIIYFILILFLHINTRQFNDDLMFGNVEHVFKWLGGRWNTWSSRIVLEFLEVTFDSLNINYWRIVDSLMFTIIAFSIAKLFTNFDFKSNSFTCLTLLLFPFLILYSAGWVSTTIVYCWTGAMGLVALLPLRKILDGKKITVFDYVISFFSLLVALNQEQMCCLIFGFSIVFIYICYKKSIFNYYPLFLLVLSLISLFIIFICPGNSLRNTLEVLSWYPEYENFGIIQKVYLALVPTFSVIISNKILISIYAFGLYYYNKLNNSDNNHLLKYNLLLNLIITWGLTIFSSLLLDNFSVFNSFYDVLNLQAIPDFTIHPSDFYLFIPLILAVIYFINLIYLTYKSFRDNKYNVLLTIILLAGLASRFIMGFSPTIFASCERTAFYMFLVFIILILVILNNIKVKKNTTNSFLVIIIVLVIFNLINIMYNMPMVGL